MFYLHSFISYAGNPMWFNLTHFLCGLIWLCLSFSYVIRSFLVRWVKIEIENFKKLEIHQNFLPYCSSIKRILGIIWAIYLFCTACQIQQQNLEFQIVLMVFLMILGDLLISFKNLASNHKLPDLTLESIIYR